MKNKPSSYVHLIPYDRLPNLYVGEPIGFPSMETKFHNLAYVLQNEGGSYNMIHGQRWVHYLQCVQSVLCMATLEFHSSKQSRLITT